jgi:hypothetical protein
MDRPITVGELRKVLEAGSCNAEFGAVEAISAMLSAIPKDEPDNLNGVPIHNIDDFQAEILLQSGACTLGGLIECYKRYGEKFEQEEMKKSEPEADKLPHFHQGICKKCGRLKWLKDDTTMCAECMNEPDPPRDIETNSTLPDNLKDEILDFKMKLMGKHGVHPIDSDWEAFILEREARLQSLNAELADELKAAWDFIATLDQTTTTTMLCRGFRQLLAKCGRNQ